jgi:hypothetical protein
MDRDLQQLLETFIDDGSLSAVLDNLAMVCFAKAAHLQSNWQDGTSAKAWDDAGGMIAKLASKIDL